MHVTNDGRVAALTVPPADDPLEDLVARGQARPPVRALSTLRDLPRVRLTELTRDIMDDFRKPW